MKTQINVSETRQPSLTRAVIRHIGERETLEDVARHSADAGWAGFTYYNDTVEFARKHKAEILERASEDAKEYGMEGVISFLAGFGCLKGYTQEQIADGLYNPKSEDRTTIYNALAWYALEEIARELNPDL